MPAGTFAQRNPWRFSRDQLRLIRIITDHPTDLASCQRLSPALIQTFQLLGQLEKNPLPRGPLGIRCLARSPNNEELASVAVISTTVHHVQQAFFPRMLYCSHLLGIFNNVQRNLMLQAMNSARLYLPADHRARPVCAFLGGTVEMLNKHPFSAERHFRLAATGNSYFTRQLYELLSSPSVQERLPDLIPSLSYALQRAHDAGNGC